MGLNKNISLAASIDRVVYIHDDERNDTQENHANNVSLPLDTVLGSIIRQLLIRIVVVVNLCHDYGYHHQIEENHERLLDSHLL